MTIRKLWTVTLALQACLLFDAVGGFVPAEYLESDGTTYFQTTIKGYPTMTVEAKVWLPLTTSYCALCGSEAAADNWMSPVGFTKNGSSATEVYATIRAYGMPVSVKSVPISTWVTLRGTVTAAGRKFYIDDELVFEDDKGSTITESNAKDIRLFAGINRYAEMKNVCVAGTRVASLKIWRSEDISTDPIASYAPVADQQTGDTFLYDSVTETYLRPFNDKKPNKVYVAPDGSDSNPGFTSSMPFKTISKALAETGSDVILAAGRYPLTAGVTIESGKHLYGATGNARDVVLDGCGNVGPAVTFGKDPTKPMSVESLTVSNCYRAAGLLMDAVGICAARSYWGGEENPVVRNLISNCVVTCCSVSGSAANYRNAVSLDFYSRLVDSVVVSNRADGVRLDSGGEVLRSTIAENEEGIHGGCYGPAVDTHDGAARMKVKGCVVKNNRSTGIVDVTQVHDSWIEGNCGATMGILYDTVLSFYSDTAYVVSNCVIASNVGGDNSMGALGVAASGKAVSNFLIDSCVITNNTADYYPGLRLWAGASSTIPAGAFRVRNTLVAGNRARVGNGLACGVYVNAFNAGGDDTVRVVFENCTVTENQADNNIVAAFYLSNALAALTNCVFANNYYQIRGESVRSYRHGLRAGNGSTHTADWNAEGVFGYNYLYPAETDKTFTDAQHVVNGTAAPRFVKGTYVPRMSSPVHAKGLVLPWMTGAYDLQREDDGTPVGAAFRERLFDGNSVDIGAFQSYPTSGLILLFR